MKKIICGLSVILVCVLFLNVFFQLPSKKDIEILKNRNSPNQITYALKDMPDSLINAVYVDLFIKQKDTPFYFKSIENNKLVFYVARFFSLNRKPINTITYQIEILFIALKLKFLLTEKEMLALYLNNTFVGIYENKEFYGVGIAAKIYYQKSLRELTLAQCAMIASIIQAPSYFNPKLYSKRALIKRNNVLKKMLQMKNITSLQYQKAILEPITTDRLS